jgi:RimJ/RimL family protein N-acetyltransferase
MTDILRNLPDHFESERLVIRSYRLGDGPMYFAAGQRNRAHLQQYEADNVMLSPQTVDEAEALVRELAADWSAGRHFFLGAFEKTTGEFAAQVYVGVVSWQTPEFMIGYAADVDHEGRGYVSEAVRATVRFAFEHLGAHRLRLMCNDRNERSIRVAERCGFIREGHLLEDRRHADGSFSSSYIYRLLKKDIAE